MNSEKQALDWVVRLGDEHISRAEQRAFETWLAEDERHCASYDAVLQTWHEVSLLNDLKAIEPRYVEIAIFQRWWQGGLAFFRQPLAAAGAGVLGVVLLALFFLPQLLFSPEGETYMTGIAEVREIQLADKSIITLGARTRLQVFYNKKERQIYLGEGEAFFAVTSDPQRPFIVQSQDTKIQVIGTEFNVHAGPGRVKVAVSEGIVDVSKMAAADPIDGPSHAVERLRPGQLVVSHHYGALDSVQKVADEDIGAWRSGQFQYHQARLREIVNDANRYSTKPIVLLDDELGELRVTAGFRVDQMDKMLRALEQGLPVEISYTIPDYIVIKRSAPEKRVGKSKTQ